MKSRSTEGKSRSERSGRIKDVLLLSALALLLIFAVWKIFYTGDKTSPTTVTGSEEEQKLCALLSEIDGVGEVRVIINQNEDGTQSVVVVCEGADDLRVNMNVREAVAAALGTEEKSVKIYRMKS